MKKTICGTKIDREGFLIAQGRRIQPVSLAYKDYTLLFCENACKKEFLNAEDKEK